MLQKKRVKEGTGDIDSDRAEEEESTPMLGCQAGKDGAISNNTTVF